MCVHIKQIVNYLFCLASFVYVVIQRFFLFIEKLL